ncbi:MAG: MYXO-CTERM sorting domain-containing protein [Enhygromyxa sp.]
MLSRSLPLIALLASLLPAVAAAQGPTEDSDFSPFYEELLLGFEDSTVDTGWIPNNSPVQMRFFADAANSITIDLPGAAHYDWRTEELRFEGDPEAGLFEYDVGLEIVASVNVDVSLATWQSDLLGPYDWDIEASTTFTPYLLEGNPERPATIADKSGALDLVSIPLVPDIVILSGNLDIALYVDIEASLHCNRIEVLGPDGEATSFTLEGESLWIDPGEGPGDLIMPATAFCQLTTWPTLIIRPHLVVTVLFDEYDIAGIDIPIDLPVVDEELELDTIPLHFPRWEEPEDEGDGGGESGEDGGDEIGDDVGDETGTGGEELGGELVDGGCSCSSGSSGEGRGLAGLGLGLLVLASVRRRRSSAATTRR